MHARPHTGKYIVPVPRGLNVELQVTYNNHTFARVNYADRQPKGKDAGFVSSTEDLNVGVEYFYIQQPTDRLDYEDISTVSVTVELAGGV